MREVDVQLSNSNEMNDHEFVRKDLLLMHIWTLKGMKVTNSMTPLFENNDTKTHTKIFKSI